ncbi:MAG: DUF2752 domain-containing protein [bacterium]|nr:DUF2752 domain-containing protein [bacterium]
MKKRIVILTIAILTIVALVNVYYFVFIKNKIVVPCLFHEITGFYCPGCGVTRMMFSLINLDFYQAFRYNQLLFISLPFIMVCIIDKIVKWLVGNPNYLHDKINDKVWITLLLITVLFGILRNISIFDYLIPTTI